MAVRRLRLPGTEREQRRAEEQPGTAVRRPQRLNPDAESTVRHDQQQQRQDRTGRWVSRCERPGAPQRSRCPHHDLLLVTLQQQADGSR